MTRAQKIRDPDAQLVRAASRRVGIWITLAVSLLVLVVLVATLLVVFSQIPPAELFRPGRHETTVDIEGVDIVVGAILVGVGAIALAGTIALLITRRAVAPLIHALRRQRRFVADASHELRTPLAILDARLQVLQRATKPEDPNAKLIAELRGDSRALGAVVTDLLDSVDATAQDSSVAVQVDRCVQAAVTAMRMLARDRSVDIVATPTPSDVTVAIPETSLHRTLVALLDNAIKHSPPSVATVTTSATRTTVTITVTDQGPGIRGIDPQRVFDRFARSSDAVDGGGTARTGFGIGLALVHDTVTRHGGTAAVSNTSPAGTSITITLPRTRT